jgi:multimeric flavodoxin WrbA
LGSRIVVLQGSPRKDGNTAALAGWFAQGARSGGSKVETIETAFLKYKSTGCTACRACQRSAGYRCVIDDGASPVLAKMAASDVIAIATPLLFYQPSAQLKLVYDRMFSLYKWNNENDTFATPLKGKTLVLIASAYEELGLKTLEKPFRMIAEYTGMKFRSLLVRNAGVSGGLKGSSSVRAKAIKLGKLCARV